MPIHNHLGMYGVVKVLFGSGRIQSYSQCDDMLPTIGKLLDVNLVDDRVVSVNDGSNIVHLEPHCGNIHSISSTEDSPLVFMDLLTPPYDHVTYTISYFDLISCDPHSSKCKLKVVPEPAEFTCGHLEYSVVAKNDLSE